MEVTINDKKYAVIVERKKIKNTYIRLKDDLTIYVTTNKLVGNKTIIKLINENINSIENMVDKKQQQLEKNQNFYYFGKRYDVVYGNCFESISFEGNKIYVKDEITLEKYLKNELVTIARKRLDYYFHLFKESIPYPNLKFRKMKTRWGVCNKRDYSITLNSELLKKDIECLNYVIVHEMSHFVHFNHSKAFWKTVFNYYPNYSKVRKELRN